MWSPISGKARPQARRRFRSGCSGAGKPAALPVIKVSALLACPPPPPSLPRPPLSRVCALSFSRGGGGWKESERITETLRGGNMLELSSPRVTSRPRPPPRCSPPPPAEAQPRPGFHNHTRGAPPKGGGRNPRRSRKRNCHPLASTSRLNLSPPPAAPPKHDHTRGAPPPPPQAVPMHGASGARRSGGARQSASEASCYSRQMPAQSPLSTKMK